MTQNFRFPLKMIALSLFVIGISVPAKDNDDYTKNARPCIPLKQFPCLEDSSAPLMK